MTVTSSRCVVRLALSMLVLASCSNKSAAPVRQEDDLEAERSGTGKVTADDPDQSLSVDPLADNVVGKIAETTGNLQLSAEVVSGVITSAKIEIIKDDAIDAEATGVVIFKLASVDEDDEQLTFLDMTARACGEDEDEDEDNDCGDLECYDDDDCPLEKPLANGVATLFDEQTVFDVSEAIATDEIELQAEYSNPPSPPKSAKGRFELGVE